MSCGNNKRFHFRSNFNFEYNTLVLGLKYAHQIAHDAGCGLPGSGVAVGWGGGQSPAGPQVQGPRVPGKKLNNFPVTVKTRTSGYQTLECFIATLPTAGVCGRLVHVGETFNRFAYFGL